MELLKFTLSGEHAFFKKPDVNSVYYFSYSCIHKVALLGIFGAILGYGGYSEMHLAKTLKGEKNIIYPDFYQKLEKLKIGIVPNYKAGMIPKKIQYFNNSVGYASKEQGGNLIVKEQWIENPSWDIYVALDCEESNLLAESIEQNRCVYVPYLGKNDHIANITSVERVSSQGQITDSSKIDSLYRKVLASSEELEDEEVEEILYKYEEVLPLGLDPITNLYQMDRFVYSNVEVNYQEDILLIQDKKIVLF